MIQNGLASPAPSDNEDSGEEEEMSDTNDDRADDDVGSNENGSGCTDQFSQSRGEGHSVFEPVP